MINFRAKPGFRKMIDEAARAAGVDRSTFIRDAVEARVVIAPMAPRTVIGTPKRTPPPETMTQASSDCPHPTESLVKLPTGIRMCQACGARLRV